MERLRSALHWLWHGPTLEHLSPGLAVEFDRYEAAAQAIANYRVGRPTWPERDPAIYDRDGYRQLALIFRCVNLIAHAAGTAPVRVYDESQDDKPLPDHPLRRLLRQPNPYQGEAVFWANVAMRTAIAGFCVVEKERSRAGDVLSLYPLNSLWLQAVPRTPQQFDWDYRVPGVRVPYRLAAEDVIVFRWADTPDGSPYGLSPIAAALRSVGLVNKMIAFLGVLFERGGVPLYGLIPDLLPGQKLDQAEVDALTTRFLQRHGGIEKSALPLILAGVKDVKQLGFDLDQLAYTDLRDVSELEIVQAFGVPPTKAMLRVGLEHADSRANAEVDDATFYRDTMVPIWARFDDSLTTSLLPDFAPPGSPIQLTFDTSDIAPLQPDRNARAGWLIQGFTGGGISQHTMFRELGLPLPDTPDFYLRGIAFEAIPADGVLSGGGTASGGQLGGKRARELLAGDGPAERYAKIGAQNRKAILQVAATRKPSIGRFFKAQAKRVIAALEAPVGIAALAGHNGHEHYALQDIDWAAEDRLLTDVLTRLHILAGETAYSAAADHLGMDISWDLANPHIRDVLDKLTTRVPDINQTTLSRVADLVTQQLQQGASIPEIADKLQETFDGWSDERAETIARSQSQVSYNSASALAYRESGVVSKCLLLDNPTHDSDPLPPTNTTCAQRNGMKVPLDAANGEFGVEDYIASAHANCILCIAPIVDGDDE